MSLKSCRSFFLSTLHTQNLLRIFFFELTPITQLKLSRSCSQKMHMGWTSREQGPWSFFPKNSWQGVHDVGKIPWGEPYFWFYIIFYSEKVSWRVPVLHKPNQNFLNPPGHPSRLEESKSYATKSPFDDQLANFIFVLSVSFFYFFLFNLATTNEEQPIKGSTTWVFPTALQH